MKKVTPTHLFPTEGNDVFREEIADLVRRSLLEMGQICEITDRIKQVSERLSHVTPPPSQNPNPSN
jgi:hypothetical protein